MIQLAWVYGTISVLFLVMCAFCWVMDLLKWVLCPVAIVGSAIGGYYATFWLGTHVGTMMALVMVMFCIAISGIAGMMKRPSN